MAVDDSFGRILQGLRGGDEDAAGAVYERFVRRLVALAARQFDDRLRGNADPEDVVQSAFRTAFRRIEQGEYDLGDWGALWGLLATITVRKCGRRRAYLRAGRRDAGREPAAARHEVFDPWQDVADREPTPEEAAMLAETVREWLAGLGPGERSVIQLGLQGEPDPEIARRLLRTERSVRRLRLRAEDRLRQYVSTFPREAGQP
jgi:RNA polymerase sigma-70 factor (ECF subfamily)